MWNSDNIETARKWLTDSRHLSRETHDRSLLPTRVLDVSGGVYKEGSDVVRLHKSSSGEIAPYCALSYCWGGPQATFLSVSTIDDFLRQGIPTANLDKTVLDAIRVIRDLNMQYLWIDALCIIQDSEEDQANELRRMANIYQQANVTIVASNAAGSIEGFLRARLSDPFKRMSSDGIRLPLAKKGIVHANPIAINETATHLYLTTSVDPIHKRCWTLQEEMMSTRLLIFDSYRMRWKDWYRNLTDGRGRLETIDEFPFRASLKRPDSRTITSPREAYGDWVSIVRQYSGRRVTYAKDKLPAISAVAQLYGNVFTGKYLAGLWEEFLIEGLLWYIAEGCHWSTIRPQYITPSWSWASSIVQVSYKSEERETTDLEVLFCKVKLVTESLPYGEVEDGVLVVSGRLTKGYPPFRRKEDGNTKRLSCDRWFRHFTGFSHDNGGLKLESPEILSEGYFLQVKQSQRRLLPEGLILERTTGGHFKRVGLFHWSQVGDSHFERMNEMFDLEQWPRSFQRTTLSII